MRRSDGCLLTAYDEGYQAIADICVPTMRLYAERQGIDFRAVTDASDPRSPHWVKIGLVLGLFDEGYDFVFWVDVDAYFRRFDADIRQALDPDHDFFFVDEDHIPAPPGRKARLNSGVFVMRNTPLVRRFLLEVNGMTRQPNWPWNDQSAMHEVFGFESMRTGDFSQPDPLNHDYVDRIGWLSNAWNCGVGFNRRANAIIRHIYGGGVSDKSRRAAFIVELDKQLADSGARPEVIENVIYDAFNALDTLYEFPMLKVREDSQQVLYENDRFRVEIERLRTEVRELRQDVERLAGEGRGLRQDVERQRRDADASRDAYERLLHRTKSRSWLLRQLTSSLWRKTLGSSKR